MAFFSPMQTKTFWNKKKTNNKKQPLSFILGSVLLTYSVFLEADCVRQEIYEQNCPSCSQDTGTDLPHLQVICSSRLLSRACASCKWPQPSPCHCSFPLSSGRWHCLNKCFSSRHLNNIFLVLCITLNHTLNYTHVKSFPCSLHGYMADASRYQCWRPYVCFIFLYFSQVIDGLSMGQIIFYSVSIHLTVLF